MRLVVGNVGFYENELPCEPTFVVLEFESLQSQNDAISKAEIQKRQAALLILRIAPKPAPAPKSKLETKSSIRQPRSCVQKQPWPAVPSSSRPSRPRSGAAGEAEVAPRRRPVPGPAARAGPAAAEAVLGGITTTNTTTAIIILEAEAETAADRMEVPLLVVVSWAVRYWRRRRAARGD